MAGENQFTQDDACPQTSSVQPMPNSAPKQVKTNQIVIKIMTISIILLLSLSGYLYYQNNELKQSIMTNETESQTSNKILDLSKSPFNELTPNRTPSPVVFPKLTPISLPTANPELLANGKIYKSDTLKISMKLPNLWYTHKEELTNDQKGYTTHISYPVDNSSPQVYVENQKANIVITLQPKEEDIEQRASNYLINNDPYHPLAITSLTSIDGQKTVILEVQSEHGSKIVLVDTETFSYYISIEIPDLQNSPELSAIVYQILSTIKFTQ
jgi:hypothetical protein